MYAQAILGVGQRVIETKTEADRTETQKKDTQAEGRTQTNTEVDRQTERDKEKLAQTDTEKPTHQREHANKST